MNNCLQTIAWVVALALAPTCHGKDLNEALMTESTLVLPAPDLAKLQTQGEQSSGAYRYGTVIPVESFGVTDKSLPNWTQDEKGDWHWQYEVASPGARLLEFHFSSLKLPEGARLTIRGEGEENFRVVESHEAINESVHSPFVAGDRATLELFAPNGSRDATALILASVTHGFRDLFRPETRSKSATCNIDVACSEGNNWRNQIASVVLYTFKENGSQYSCTATLLANTSNTKSLQLLTARHCINSKTTAETVVAYWNYQSTTCRASDANSVDNMAALGRNNHAKAQTGGAEFLASKLSTDFALIRLKTALPAGVSPFFSGWNRGNNAPDKTVGIHHPSGHEKRIASDGNKPVIAGAGDSAWKVDWDKGTVQEGSSGSGLWDQNKRLVGQLGGSDGSICHPISYYGRLSKSWDGLSGWLDPKKTGATAKDGYSW